MYGGLGGCFTSASHSISSGFGWAGVLLASFSHIITMILVDDHNGGGS
jgi:hypothetical protein